MTVRAQVQIDSIEGCWVAPAQGRGPVKVSARATEGYMVFLSSGRKSAQGIIHFLGGAFAGAAPQLLYPVVVGQLASQGYTVIATPFPVRRLPITPKTSALGQSRASRPGM